ncbi:MAG: flagellar biosynthetic protein FliR [Lachnospiraceae bacterium]|nr:flagellar biosynthetic protein FliR [Lachnospiraceae bacterium]
MLNYSFSIAELEYFLLILVRTMGFIFSAPFFSDPSVPRNVKVGYGLLFSVLLYNILPSQAVVYSSIIGYSVIVIKETITGLIIGYGANLCSTILAFAGHIADMEIGLSMVSMMDPTTRTQVTISGMFYQYTVGLLLFISGLYQYILLALKESFVLIPINGAIFSSERFLQSMLEFLKDYISVGFRICLPVFCAMILLNAVLGMLAKVSPQLNMFAVGIQIKVLLGLFIMFVTAGMLPRVSSLILSETKTVVTMFVESMM